MKSFALIVLCVVVVRALQPLQNYHDAAGVPHAARVLELEQAREKEPVLSRIVGGVQAQIGAHPYLGGLVIALVDGRTSMCGSTLLSNTHGVTAAHCWWDGRTQARQFTVVYGSDRLYSGGTRINTSNVEIHEGFNPTTYTNDIAIIRHQYVQYTAYISPVLLPTGNLQYADVWAVAVGYGRSSHDLMGSELMDKRQVTLHVMTNANCRLTWAANMILTTTLCTSSAGGMSVCAGDSGGPLVIGAPGARTLIGIISFGADAGCSFGVPAAHTRVTSYTTWINNRI